MNILTIRNQKLQNSCQQNLKYVKNNGSYQLIKGILRMNNRTNQISTTTKVAVRTITSVADIEVFPPNLRRKIAPGFF